MDKYEYKVRSEELSKLIDEEKYAEAVNIADMIDWRRVKNITMLLKVAALYRTGRRNEDSRAVLLLAYDKYPTNRSVVYLLCEVSIELDDVVAAIEYYKEFVKLAPRDNGVFTLRYRILEAQEASLEERIELLEELKKRDYQEEWAYELAYLYHRVGLATKCVEECDDIILFFGDGAYVMKAMELKMLHVPLTDVQQAKYDIMIGNADRNYTSEVSYEDDNGQQEYSEENYAEEDYAEEDYAEDGAYAEDTYNDGAYNETEYADEPYNDEGYGEELYDDAPYDEEAYGEESGSGETYDDASYNEEVYDEEAYGEEAYSEEAYNEEPYSEEPYDEQAYNRNSDTGEFYVEQTFDENSYSDSQPEPVPSSEPSASSSAPVPSYSGEDMSQYNTINLQRVVAESMKELFPDDDEDMFAKENLDIEPESSFETRTYVSPKEQLDKLRKAPDADGEEAKDNENIQQEKEEAPRNTGKVAAMVSKVSEASPEPNTGAIKKVFVPGDDARFMKDDAEGNGTAEGSEAVKTVEAGEDDKTAEETFQPMTGQMNLDDVLAEWEHIKQENVQKSQEAVMKQVKRQTGKIIANFDNAVKNEMIDEYEGKPAGGQKEEEDDFLGADITGQVPQSKLEELVAKELGGNTDVIPQEDITRAAVEIKETEETDEVEEIEEIEENTEPEEYDVSDDTAQIEETAKLETGYSDEEYSDEEYAQDGYSDEEYSDEEYAQTENDYSQSRAPLDPEDEESIAEMAKEDALRTQEIKMNTAELSSLSDKILATTKKEANGAKPEELRNFTPEEQKLFENFAVTKKIKKQILFALDKMTLAAYTGNIIITGEAGLDTIKLAQNLVREFQAADANFSGKIAKITGEKLNLRNLKDVFDKLNNGAIIIEKANGMTEQKLYEMAMLLNQESIGIIVIIEDTKKEITKLLEKQAMIADYFNIRVDLMEMDNNALVAYAKNYALALEYSIDELGILALYTRISNMQGGNHVVTKDEVRAIIDDAIWKSKRSKIKNFVDVLFAKRYDSEDMIVLKERDFM